MEVKEKNKKLLIVVGVLLLFGGISLAYFVSKAILGGNGGSTSVTTAVINGATLNVEGVLSFEDLDILPGHKTVSAIKVTATGNNELIPYNLIWQGTNTLTTPLNFTIYKTSEQLSVTSTCSKKTKIISGAQALSEECNISNIDKLGNEIASGTINKNDTKVNLVKDEFITATSTGQTVYYYIILEYPNLDEPQNYDLEGSIDGKVTVEESNIKPDINILAAYIEDDGTYKQVDDIPQEGYQLNTEKSTCSNGATPTGITPNITINNLNKSGTSCYLYFDKYRQRVDDIITANNPKTEQPDFTQVAITDEGVYATSDGMYGGTSYYWRGAATTNYVKFAGYCWRIIRINGDKSIRLLYDGSTCHQNGESTTDSIAVQNVAYNLKDDKSEYVGWTYVEGQQRPGPEDTSIDSNAKIKTEEWFKNNISIADQNKVSDGKFCNDRNVISGQKWQSAPSSPMSFTSGSRRESPSLKCENLLDIYNTKIGLITLDEIIFASSSSGNSINSASYLFNGQNYWSMSPLYYYVGSSYNFYVERRGYLNNDYLLLTYGIRPVINLRSDITFSSGDGTIDNPYIVAN